MPEDFTIEQLELFAYTFFANVASNMPLQQERHASFLQSIKDSEPALLTGEAPSQAWRRSDHLRKDTYAVADGLFKALTEAGFEIKPPKPAVLKKALHEIMTEPAHQAYELDRIPRFP